MYSEIYKLLMKEVEDDTNKWKDIPCSWTTRLNIVKIAILPKAINTIPTQRFSAIYIKSPMIFFTGVEQKIVKFVWKQKTPQIAKANLRKNNRAGGIRLPNFRLPYKATVMRTI